MFTDRQKAYDVIEAVTNIGLLGLVPYWWHGSRLPRGWQRLVKEFLDWMPKRLDEYVKAAMQTSVLKDGRKTSLSTMPNRHWLGA